MKKVNFVSTALSSGHAIRGVGFYIKNLLPELKKQALKYNIQIVENSKDADLTHYPFFDLFASTLPAFPSSKTVVTVHDVIPLEYPDKYPVGIKGKVNLVMQKMAIKNVDLVITDSMASVSAIHKHLNIPNKKLKLVYLAAANHFKKINNSKLLQKVSEKYKLPNKFVLYVGDLNWNKNVPGLISACKIANMPLVWVGKQATEIEKMDITHPELAHLKTVLQLLDKNVYRLGFVPDEDLVAIYNLAKIYCQPSFAEGFGLPVLEALACGTAVACSNSHSLPEVAGECATYFDPSNIEEIANALDRPLKINCDSQVAKFSWQKTAEQTLQAYCELL